MRTYRQSRAEGECDRPAAPTGDLCKKAAFRKGEQAAPHAIDRERHNRRRYPFQNPFEPSFKSKYLTGARDASLTEDSNHFTICQPCLDCFQCLCNRFCARLKKNKPPLLSQHLQESTLNVRAVDDQADWARTSEHNDESIQPREMIGDDYRWPYDRHEVGPCNAKPIEHVYNRRDNNADRCPRRSVDGNPNSRR